MKYGVIIFHTEDSIRPAQLAQELEVRGFESLFVPEHTHIPILRKSPFPGGGELPSMYVHCIDPFVALTAAATVTTRLKLATGICLMIERDPIATAKAVASLDLLSNGRVIFGIGAGWNLEEMENHGTDPKLRRTVLRERIEAMQAMWTQERSEYHGRFVNFDPLWSYPKPLQKPHPPILMGGIGARALEAAAQYCDGWMPTPRIPDLAAKIAHLRELTARAGRDPKAMTVSIFFAPPRREAIEKYAELGVERVILNLPSAGADVILPKLDQYAQLMR